jgi:hypothetical protein
MAQKEEAAVVTPHRIGELRHLEGRQICLALAGGTRIDDCQLVSAGRPRTETIWVFSAGKDAFLPLQAVVDFWEARPATNPNA